MNKILIIGESCSDIYTYCKSYRLAPEAPVPVIQPIYDVKVGGMAMNVYENVKSIGVEVDIITNPNWEQITKHRFIDERTNQMFVRIDSYDQNYQKLSIQNIDFSSYSAIIISDYNKGFLSEDDIAFISKQHSVVFLDTKKILGDWAKDILFIKINDYEYEVSKKHINNNLQDLIIITKGSKGCEYKGKVYPVSKVDVKDTCGAGDTFLAGLVCEYISSYDINKSIQFANECATQVIQKRGTSKTTLKLK